MYWNDDPFVLIQKLNNTDNENDKNSIPSPIQNA